MIKRVHVHRCISPYGPIDFEQAEKEILDLLNRRHRQLLVHSFLYYKLDETIIADQEFDKLCRETIQLHKDYPEIAKKAVYYDICKNFDESGSGYFIKEYPGEIVTTAFRLLAHVQKISLAELAARYGFSVQKRE